MPISSKIAGESVEELPPEYLAEIGRVVVRWNMLEGYLDLSLINLLGKPITDPRALVLFIHMAIPQKLDILAAMVAALANEYPGLKRNYANAAPLLKEAQRQRNAIIHAKWGMDNGVVMASAISARGALKMSERPISLEEVITASKSIFVAAEALYKLAWNPKWGE